MHFSPVHKSETKTYQKEEASSFQIFGSVAFMRPWLSVCLHRRGRISDKQRQLFQSHGHNVASVVIREFQCCRCSHNCLNDIFPLISLTSVYEMSSLLFHIKKRKNVSSMLRFISYYKFSIQRNKELWLWMSGSNNHNLDILDFNFIRFREYCSLNVYFHSV